MPSTGEDSRVQLVKTAHVVYYHTDLSKVRQFFLDFGLNIVEEREDAIFYAGYGVEPYCYVARKSTTGQAAFGGAAYVVSSRRELEKALQLTGASHQINYLDGPGGGEVVTITDPAGFKVHLVHGQKESTELHMPSEVKRVVFNYEDEKLREGIFQRFEPGPAPVYKWGHYGIVYPEGKYKEMYEFYTKNFNLLPTDIILVGKDQKPGVLFLHIDLGLEYADHHSFFLKEAEPGEAVEVAHSAFEVHDFDVQQLGHNFLEAQGYKLCWGVGRHFLGSQIFDYWWDPSGFMVEHYADGDVVNKKTPVARVPAGPKTLAVWGPSVPDAF